LPADNAAFYGENQIPFVMGTTGGDREKLIEDTIASGTYAVIAPQMGKQVNVSDNTYTFYDEEPKPMWTVIVMPLS